MDRLKLHLVKLGIWSDKQHTALEEEMKTVVDEAWKEAVTYGTMTEPPFLDVHLMFEDVFTEMPEHLKKQQEELLALEAGQA